VGRSWLAARWWLALRWWQLPPVSWLGPETADWAPEKKKGQAVDAMFCILRLALGEGTGD